MRDKLIDLLDGFISYEYNIEELVDTLIANGVTVQALDGCNFCQKFDFAGVRAEVEEYGAYIALAICNTKFSAEERFKFCPMCGRILPQPPKGE